MSKVIMIGLDLAKNMFQVHGVEASGTVVVRRQLRRGQVEKLCWELAPAIVGVVAGRMTGRGRWSVWVMRCG